MCQKSTEAAKLSLLLVINEMIPNLLISSPDVKDDFYILIGDNDATNFVSSFNGLGEEYHAIAKNIFLLTIEEGKSTIIPNKSTKGNDEPWSALNEENIIVVCIGLTHWMNYSICKTIKEAMILYLNHPSVNEVKFQELACDSHSH